MLGSLNNQIQNNIRNILHSQCNRILVEAYKLAKSDPVFKKELDEDVYTAVLVDRYMPRIPLKYNGNWFVAPQVPYYTEEHLDGVVSISKAPRPDIRFEKYVLSNPDSFKYTIEAKKIKASSSKLKRRYISTGIQNFLSGRYPDGCLVGYVIKCNSKDCINGINKLMIKEKRGKEILINGQSIGDHEEVYQSYHENNILLKHIFLEFP